MFRSMTRMTMLLAALFLSVSFARAQETKIKKVPIKPTAADSGEEMYKEYCAACHGKAGKGDGPAVAALKAPPSDLTMLAMKNGGKFPTDHVMSVLSMGVAEAAHGSKDMPVWGTLFGALEPGGNARGTSGVVLLRIHNLSGYLESIQMK
jgi:mono/diheme cytochrome c family protein